MVTFLRDDKTRLSFSERRLSGQIQELSHGMGKKICEDGSQLSSSL